MVGDPCARGGCTAPLKESRRAFCSKTCVGLAHTKLRLASQPCGRDGCAHMGKPVFCSRKCAGQVTASRKSHAFFVEMGRLGHASRRKVGRDVLTPSDLGLMARGRYKEAARQIYDRGYTAGWVGHHRGVRQLPERKAG